MLEERVLFALDNFLIPNYFIETNSYYELIEEDKNGKSLLKLQVGTEDNLCMQHYDSSKVKKCNFIRDGKEFHMRNFIDHFILRKYNNFWELHMIEMKTTVGFRTWFDIKYKMRASYLNIKALAVFLGISLQDDNIFAYTTYEKENFDIKSMDSQRILVPKVGNRAINHKKDEWDAGFITIPIIPSDNSTFVKLKHKKIKMNRSDDGKQLEGETTLIQNEDNSNDF